MIQLDCFGPEKSSFDTSFTGKCISVDEYEKLHRLGEGTYGVVYKAKHKSTGQIAALKRIRMEQEKEGLPISSLREISILRSLKHENVVSVSQIAVGKDLDSIFLVMEYCQQDMAHLMDTMTGKFGLERVYNPSQVKCLVGQLVKGVSYLHSRYIIHRDLKLSNLLLTETGILKIADFGLARGYRDPPVPLTPRVVTLWYRAPELLLGASDYSTAIDIWAMGCIFGELLKSSPLLPGRVEMDQINLICKLLGCPTPSIWPDLESLPLYSSFQFPDYEYDNLSQEFAEFSRLTKGLLKSMLVYCPSRRIRASDALKHEYFDESPRACPHYLLPTYPETRENLESHHQKYQDRLLKRKDHS